MVWRGSPKRKRQDHYRWLRSDGTPNFSNRVYEVEGELEMLASKPAVGVSPTSSIMNAIETMAKSYRSLVVTRANRLEGILLSTHLVDYLGGGPLFSIVEKRHGLSVYSALMNETVESIEERHVIVGLAHERISDALRKMALHGLGVLPVVKEDRSVVGVITEHDLVRALADAYKCGVRASDVMSSPVVTAGAKDRLSDAMKRMVGMGFRRLPVTEGDVVVGIITSMDVVRYYGTHAAFSRAVSGDIREANSIEVGEIMNKDVVTVEPSTDICEVVRTMLARNVSSVLVTDDHGGLMGIVTERDVLYAIASQK